MFFWFFSYFSLLYGICVLPLFLLLSPLSLEVGGKGNQGGWGTQLQKTPPTGGGGEGRGEGELQTRKTMAST